MSADLYDLLFEKVAEGQDPDVVKSAFARLFSIDLEKVERIFAAEQAVLKTGIDLTTAEKYVVRLASIGVVATKRRIHAVPPNMSEPSDAASPAPADGEDRRSIPFEFHGEGFEYFKIWIVNIVLSIVTLGIYSAWAKVRNKQYFYGNTSLDGLSFEYTADPLKILKGRVIAVAFFGAYTFFAKTSPFAAAAIALLFFVLMPWIIVNSLKFNARHSSYRNISFRFVGSLGGAVNAFILWPLAAIFTLGILFPVVLKKQTQFITNNHLFGTAPFAFDVSVNEYYKMLLIIVGGSLLVGAVIMTMFGTSLVGLSGGGLETITAVMELILAIITYAAFYLIVIAYFVVTKTNIHFNNTQLRPHHFESNWSTISYALLLLTNTLGILLTLGLFIPFAKVRTAAYKASHMTLMAHGDLERFFAAEQEQSNSLAEGVNDVFDIDFSV